MKKVSILELIIIFTVAVVTAQIAFAQRETPPGIGNETIPGQGSHRGWEQGQHKGWGNHIGGNGTDGNETGGNEVGTNSTL